MKEGKDGWYEVVQKDGSYIITDVVPGEVKIGVQQGNEPKELHGEPPAKGAESGCGILAAGAGGGHPLRRWPGCGPDRPGP